jgi:hypothetical protein
MDESHPSDGAAAPRSLAATLALTGLGLLGAGARPFGAAVGLGRRTTWAVAGPVWRSGAVAPVRRAAQARIASLVAEGAVRERRWRAAIGATLAGPVVDTVTRAAVEHAVVERVVSRLLAAGTLERVAEEVADSPLRHRAMDEALDGLVPEILESAATNRIVAQALASPGLERLVVQVMESRLVDDLTDRVLAGEELQRVIRHFAQSRDVREAITESGASLADEFAGEVRTRAVVADDRAERAARRLLRRKPIIRMGPPEPPAPSGAPG